MSAAYVWAIALIVVGLSALIVAYRLATPGDYRVFERHRLRRWVTLWLTIGVMALSSGAGVALGRIAEDSSAWVAKCHHLGGVVVHDACFKPGSEIHVS